MKERSSEIIHVLTKFGKSIVVIVFIGIGVHLSVMLIDYFLIKKPLYLNLENNFVGSAFSYPMIPIIIAYFIFTLITFNLWQKMKQALIMARENDLRHEKQRVMLETLQKITGILGQHITAHNSEIQRWIADTKMKNRQPPKAVETSSRKIAEALGALSEMAFMAGQDGTALPDLEKIHDMKDIEVVLRRKISQAEDTVTASEILRTTGKIH